jgi:cytochrome c oxidase subunit II
MRRAIKSGAIATVPLFAAGCREMQSALAPAGPEAEKISFLFWAMTWGSIAITLGLIALTLVAMFGSARWRRAIASEALVVGAGIIFPVVVLAALLAYGFFSLRANASPPGEKTLRIAVVGEQWWWRVTYQTPDGRRVESANELRIPVGRSVTLELTSADVIHSLWIPTLAGKLDMIPGRMTRMHVTASKAGVSRGQCAEYCGGAHALMSFYVVASSEAEFEAWLAREAGGAQPATDTGTQGERLFHASGCGACHAVRGTSATGTIGPDLTHVGGRMSLAAAALPNDAGSFARWIRDNQHIKPDNRMPPYGIFSEQELGAISAYLANLK